MKVILPVAGFGSRLRPHTLFKSKPLLKVAESTILGKILDQLEGLNVSEYIFVTGYKAEQIEEFVASRKINARCVLQSNPQGLGEAMHLCAPYMNDNEPVLIILGDTLFEADLKTITQASENVLCTRYVQDPSRFGVAVVNEHNQISRLVEKPTELISNQAIVGIYWITQTDLFKEELNRLIVENKRTRGEYQLTDALAAMLEKGSPFSSAEIQEWLDCGKAETWLSTNAHVLKTSQANHSQDQIQNSEIIAPCYIAPGVTIKNSKIGPNVTLLEGAVIEDSSIENSIIDQNTTVKNSQLNGTLLGDHCSITDFKGALSLASYSEVGQVLK